MARVKNPANYSEIVAIRVKRDMIDFLKLFDNKSEFILSLIRESAEYKHYLAEKEDKYPTPSLF